MSLYLLKHIEKYNWYIKKYFSLINARIMAYGKNKTTDKIVLLLNHIFFLIRILQYEISFNSGLRIHRNPKY